MHAKLIVDERKKLRSRVRHFLERVLFTHTKMVSNAGWCCANIHPSRGYLEGKAVGERVQEFAPLPRVRKDFRGTEPAAGTQTISIWNHHAHVPTLHEVTLRLLLFLSLICTVVNQGQSFCSPLRMLQRFMSWMDNWRRQSTFTLPPRITLRRCLYWKQ